MNRSLREEKEGIQIAISILPFMVGMLVSISIFRSSGALDAMISVMKPMLDLIHVPAEIVPLALIRPISGSAGLSITTDLIATYGPDSFIGRLASTMQGSTDTTFYILTVYFGAVGIRKMGDALKVGLFCRFNRNYLLDCLCFPIVSVKLFIFYAISRIIRIRPLLRCSLIVVFLCGIFDKMMNFYCEKYEKYGQ